MAPASNTARAAAVVLMSVRAQRGADKVMVDLSKVCNSGAQFRRSRAPALQFFK
jgi:hypothetical protein